MSTITEMAPAKVNLCLRILGKRPDGYHRIETLFEKIDIYDRIELRFREEGMITVICRDPDVPEGRENLCYKAAALLKKTCGVANGADITIEKRIPVAAGLGGGSSDAASVLKGLNRLWKLGLSVRKLAALAADIGSDVPVFIYEESYCIGTGRGEIIKPLKGGPKLWHVVVKPPIGCDTGSVYRAYAKMGCLTLTRKGRADTILSPTVLISNMGQAEKLLYNDLEKIALKKPVINNIKKTLFDLGADGALVSGSGSSVFGLFGTRKAARDAGKELFRRLPAGRGWCIFVAKTC